LEEEIKEDLKCIRQLAPIAVTDVKSRLNPQVINLFTVVIVLKETETLGPIEGTCPLGKEIPEEAVLETNECIKLPALIAETDAKFPSNPLVKNLFTVVIVLVVAVVEILGQVDRIKVASSTMR